MNPEERRGELEILFQEYIGGTIWHKLLVEKEAADSGDRIVLYSQTEYKFENLTPIQAAIQRSIDIKLVPATYTENVKYVIREMIESFFSKIKNRNRGDISTECIDTILTG